MNYSLVVTTMRASGSDISSNCISWLNLRFVRHFDSKRDFHETYLVKILPLSTLLKNESGALEYVRSRLITLHVNLDSRHDGLRQSVMKLNTRLNSQHVE